MSYLSDGLKKFYKKQNEKIIFINNQTLNRLSFQMWDKLNYSQIDASVICRVLKGKRLFTPQQLDAFCTVLALNNQDRDQLFYLLSRDYCERYDLDLDTFFVPKKNFVDVLNQLSDEAYGSLYSARYTDAVRICDKIFAISNSLIFTSSSKIFEKTIYEVVSSAIYIKTKANNALSIEDEIKFESLKNSHQLLELSLKDESMLDLINKGIQCVAFDLEGTIIDLEDLHHKAHIYAANQVGLKLDLNNIPEIIKSVENFIGGPDHIVAEQIYQHSDRSLNINEILSLDKSYYLRLLQEKKDISPREGFFEVFELFSDMNIPMAIATLTQEDVAKYILQKSGLDRLFTSEQLVLGEKITRLKPAPDIWFETAKRMGKDPTNQLIFDDAPKGINAAIIAKSIPIGMPVYPQIEITSHLHEAGAKYIYQSWKDMYVLGGR